MIKPGEIQKLANRYRVKDGQIEKDYIISWVLFGIAQNPFLKKNLIFKGGTLLKKAYFPDYRFSEDLDFTLLDNDISNDQLLSAFRKTGLWIEKESRVKIQVDGFKEHKKSGSPKFLLNYAGPLGGTPGSKTLKVDVTRQEILEFESVERTIFAGYSDLSSDDFALLCYQLSEVLIEKMTALVGRTIPRDLYDFWYLLETENMDLPDNFYYFENKCRNKGYNPERFKDKLSAKEDTFHRDWENSLNNQVHELPDFKVVWRAIGKHLRKI
jgi:uncharacterized protein